MRTLTHLPLVAGILMAMAACSPADSAQVPEGIMDRETFIEAYMELRAAGLTTPDQTVDLTERDRILAERGLTDQDMMDFVEAWGRDPAFMEALWTEIDDRMRNTRRDQEEEPGLPQERARGGEEPGDPGERPPVRRPAGGERS